MNDNLRNALTKVITGIDELTTEFIQVEDAGDFECTYTVHTRVKSLFDMLQLITEQLDLLCVNN